MSLFPYQPRYFSLNPLLGYHSVPQYGTDRQGFPYWSQRMPFTGIDHFESEMGCTVAAIQGEFGVQVRIHQLDGCILIWPEHAYVEECFLARERGKMDRFYKFVYLFGQEARGLNNFTGSSIVGNYLKRFLDQENKKYWDWATPDPPRYYPYPVLSHDDQHIRDEEKYLSQFKKNDSDTIYSRSRNPQVLRQGSHTGMTNVVGNHDSAAAIPFLAGAPAHTTNDDLYSAATIPPLERAPVDTTDADLYYAAAIPPLGGDPADTNDDDLYSAD